MTGPAMFNLADLTGAGPLPNPIQELLERLRQPVPLRGAHTLPATVTTAAPLARSMPGMVVSAPATNRAHLLPTMHASAPQVVSPGEMSMADLGPVPGMGAMAVDANTQPPAPSAISALLATLTAPPPQAAPTAPQGAAGGAPGAPGGPMTPLPPAPPMPMIGPAGGASGEEAPQGLLGRVMHSLSSIGAPNTPAGYDSLLSPQEIASAKPGFLSRLSAITPGALTPGEQQKAALDNIVKMKQIAASTTENRRIMDARREMQTRFPLDPSASIDQVRNTLAQQYQWAMSHGDVEMVKDIGSRLSTIFSAPKAEINKVLGPGSALVGPDGRILAKADAAEKTADYQNVVDKNGNVHAWRKDQDLPPGWHPVPLQQTMLTIAGAGERQGARDAAAEDRARTAREDRFTKQFETTTKPLRDRAAVIDQAIRTISDAKDNPNPAVRKTLYTSAIANFIQAADQKAQIRWQLLNYYKNNVDPSIGGKWDVLKSRLLSGSLPQYTMEGMLTHLGNLREMVKGEINGQREGLVKRHPEMALQDVLPTVDEYFPETGGASLPTAAPAAGRPASDLYSKYKLTPKKP